MAKTKEEKTKKSKKKSSGLGIALFFLVLLILAIIILIQYPKIKANIEGAVNKNQAQPSDEITEVYNAETDEMPSAEEKTLTVKVETETKAVTAEEPVVLKTDSKAETKEPVAVPVQPKEVQPVTTTTSAQITYTDLELCFVEINSNGTISRKMVKRSVPKNDSPLATSIKLLLEGPDTTKSAEKNCMTFIPAGTKLLSAKVQGGVAYLNFNDNFDTNPEGIDGAIAQLMQVVYTATNFSTVNSVQFLIDGQKKEYLETEGQYIGDPLSRGNFR